MSSSNLCVTEFNSSLQRKNVFGKIKSRICFTLLHNASDVMYYLNKHFGGTDYCLHFLVYFNQNNTATRLG